MAIQMDSRRGALFPIDIFCLNINVDKGPCWMIDWLIISRLPLRLNASGQRVQIIILTNDPSFRPCNISLYLSLPRKVIGLLDPSSPVRLMTATWSLPDCGWWRQWDCFWFCFTPIRQARLALVSVLVLVPLSAGAVSYSTHPCSLPTLAHSLPLPYTQASHSVHHPVVMLSLRSLQSINDITTTLTAVCVFPPTTTLSVPPCTVWCPPHRGQSIYVNFHFNLMNLVKHPAAWIW